MILRQSSWTSYIIILIVQWDYFQTCVPAKFLTKPYFPYTIQFFEWVRKFLSVMSDVGTGWKLILAPLQFILPWASNMPWKLHARKNKFWICQWIGGFCYSLRMVNGLSAKWFNDCDWDRFQFSILQLITLYRVRKCKFLDNTTDNVITRSATELFWQIINKNKIQTNTCFFVHSKDRLFFRLPSIFYVIIYRVNM